MERRSFLKAMSGAVGAGALTSGQAARAQQPAVLEAPPAVPATAGLPRRILGRTGQRVSIIGFPGLGLVRDDQEVCTEAIQSAFEKGVNYFDVAPAYGRGVCETKMGIGLQGIKRSDIFLSCKTKMRDRDGCRRELENSLKLLQTDHFDLYQMHCLITVEETEQAFAAGGAMEAILKARDEGIIRYIGFSAHSTKSALTAMQRFNFDTVMFPISFVEYFKLGFGKAVLELANQQGAAILAIKGMCRGNWPQDAEKTRSYWYRPVEDEHEIEMAMRFTLSQPRVASALPPAWLDLVEKAIEAGKAYRPATPSDLEELQKLAATCESTFKKWEDEVALNVPACDSDWPDNPHECPAHHWA